MKITIGQDFDAYVWDTVKEHWTPEELKHAEIQEGEQGEAVLIWTFELDKASARKLAVMLEIVAGLGNPQGGLDMKPSRRELFK